MSSIAATHDGTLHADDIMSAALLRLIRPNIRFIRTRDPQVIASVKLVFDVGQVYDPENLRFDHHFVGSPCRPDGKPYSSIGLLWHHMGHTALRLHTKPQDVRERDYLHAWIDQKIVLPLDTVDTGHGKEADEHSMSYHLCALNPNWDETQNANPIEFNALMERRFHEALDWLTPAFGTFLQAVRGQPRVAYENFIEAVRLNTRSHFARSRESMNEAQAQLKLLWQARKGNVLDIGHAALPWDSVLPRLEKSLPDKSKLDYIIYQAPTGGWRCQCMPLVPGGFVPRKPFPLAWRGLQEPEIAIVTGIADATFCHPSGFMCGARSEEGLKGLVKLAQKHKELVQDRIVAKSQPPRRT